jgi:hypothetical protein
LKGSLAVLEAIGSIITSIKNAGPTIYGAVFTGTLLFLFLPDPILSQLGLSEFRQMYRMYAGLLSIGSACLLTMYPVNFVIGLCKESILDWRIYRHQLATLSELTDDEKEFLRPFIYAKQNTVHSEISDGVANGLQAKKIVYRSSNMSVPGSIHFPYNLQPYARKILTKRPELLD